MLRREGQDPRVKEMSLGYSGLPGLIPAPLLIGCVALGNSLSFSESQLVSGKKRVTMCFWEDSLS
jgi:hypothetical protein